MIGRYVRWLHTGWPAGTVERLPEIAPDGSTAVPGLYIAGDLAGVPLLKFAADTGARVVREIASSLAAESRTGEALADLVIVGAGVSGLAAALEAKALGLDFVVVESAAPLTTIHNFPKGKPIFTYPSGMTPAGGLTLSAAVKEPLVEELERQRAEAGISPRPGHVERVARARGRLEVRLEGGETIAARRVLIAIGRSGNYRRLDVPGEDLDKVSNRLHDPADFAGRDVLVVGGGDAAVECAVAIAAAGGRVTLSYRGDRLTRPKHENLAALERDHSIALSLGTTVKEIRPEAVVLARPGEADRTIPNQAVFTMLGREAPLDLLRRSGVRIRGDWTPATWLGLAAVLALCVFVYNWKASGALNALFQSRHWFPFAVPQGLAAAGGAFADRSSLLGTLALSLGSPGFYYSLAYCLCVVLFGARRIRRRKTPYVTAQTLTLIAVQVVPLFLLPYLLLPWMGHNGWFDQGIGRAIADQLFPATTWDPQGREYWRSFGIILAWPLFIWNVFTSKPLALWLAISFIQTFVIIPAIVLRWGKGAYCGWICSCGALAETLGDEQRRKMPHGRVWNRLNLIGQGLLAVTLTLALLRTIGWVWPGSLAGRVFDVGLQSYYWIVDVGFAGILGVGLYFHFSGRVWCRFGCPLAALMHVYARFSSFRILADKKKCISCNVCTSVCHQGIDIMSFANKGLPMEDPQCVRCSACVSSCPTGVLTFGRARPDGTIISIDALRASPVQMAESPAPRT